MAKSSGRPGPGPVGYGAKGKAFYSVKAFNASKAGNAKTPTAKNQALAPKRRLETIAGKHPGPQPLSAGSGSAAHNPSVPKMPGSYHGLTSGATPMKNAGRGPAGI